MKRAFYLAGAAVALIWSGGAVGAQTSLSEDLKSCLAITDDSARLACYDQKVAALDAAAAKMATERKESAAARQRALAAKTEADRKAADVLAAKNKVDAFGAEALPADRRAADADDSVDQLDGTITEVFFSPLKEIIVALDNRQMWRQTDGTALPPVRAGDKVVIKKRMLSGYRLTLVRQRRTIDVKRYR
jgi:hypothetical protein